MTIGSVMRQAFDDLFVMEERMNEICDKMMDADDEQMAEYMEELGTIQDMLTNHDFYMIDAKVEEVARALGLLELGLDKDVTDLSGGQRTKVLLGKLLLEKPDILLLDEPTNYLDKEHIDWLKRYLLDYENAFILISHDIPFLNSVINIIYHMDNQQLNRYVGDYYKFQEVYEMKQAQMKAAYDKQQKEIADLKDFVARNKARVATRNMAMSRQKKLDNMEMIELAKDKPKPEFNFKVARTSGKYVFTTKELVIGYDEPLSKPLNFEMERGKKIVQQVPLSGFLSQPGISAPLDKNRLLFNETHTLNGNRMYKWNDDRSLRLQAGYTHELIQQQRGNTQIYYQPTDTIQIDETYHYRLRSDIANLELRYEDNSSRNYISNRFTVDGEINRGRSEELGQTLQTSQLSAGNYFNLIRNRESGTWEFRSTTQYAYQPASLLLEEGKSKFNQHNFYTDNSAAYLRKYDGFTQQYKAGIQGERATLKYTPTRQPNDFNASHLSLHITPYFQLERGKWLATLSLPLKADRYFSQQRSFLFFNPSMYLRYKLDYHWTFSLYGSLKRSAEDFSDLYPGLYQTDYRTWRDGNGLFPTSLTQTYNLYGEYKNTVQEFFITAALTYSRSNRNTLFEQSVSENAIVYTRRELPNHNDSWNLSSTFSKGIYDWHLKTSLTLLLSRSNGEQLTRLADSEGNRQSLLQTYRYDYLKAEPKIIWSPADVFEAEYHATLGYGGSKIGSDTRLTPLLDFVQRLHLTFSIGQVDLRLSGEHYRNDLGGDAHLNTVFADASLIYKRKKWRLEASLNNLFNKKEYAYTTYSTTQSYTSRLNIRPREAMVTINHQF